MSYKSVLVTAPSGAGKTTLVKKLLKEFPQFEFSISATTRTPRSNEVDGVDYYFITKAIFDQKILLGEFLEYEEVYSGVKYGTLKQEIDKIIANNHIPIFDIDVQGALKIKEKLNENVLSIFISPPSYEVLKQRLTERNTETLDKITQRLDKSKEELQYSSHFDLNIINDHLDNTYEQFKSHIQNYLK